MTDEEIRKDIEARVEKYRFKTECAIYPGAARDMLIEYRKAVLEEVENRIEPAYESWMKNSNCHDLECGCVTAWIQLELRAALAVKEAK